MGKLTTLWQDLKKWQKLSLLLSVFGLFFLYAFIVFIGNILSYTKLYSGLETSDKRAIVTYLNKNNIKYKLIARDNAIYVPDKQIFDCK